VKPEEYGFLSNVNPSIPHPRWSQAESYWLDTEKPFATPIFNGYERFVADLYPDEPRELQEPLKPGDTAR
jgi:sulfoxide reductase catalytic subunit YedY